MSSGLDWERFGVITGGDEVCILPPPILSEKGVGIPTLVHFPFPFVLRYTESQPSCVLPLLWTTHRVYKKPCSTADILAVAVHTAS